jgi:hypothetical protein
MRRSVPVLVFACVLGILAVLCPPAGAAPPPALSYDAMFAADANGRSPGQLAWSPDGRLLAYVYDDGHSEVLWSLDPATGIAQELLHPADLAKISGRAAAEASLGAFQWSPRGDSLLMESGGDLYL